MEIKIIVRTRGQFGGYEAGLIVPELMEYAFEPLHTEDEPMMAFSRGTVLNNSFEAVRVLRTRKNAAEELSKILTNHILLAMEKSDTHNGYTKEDMSQF